jgi:hypothetical protein
MVMAGCYTLSVVNFGNGTATSVRVRSSQTGQEIEVKPGAFKKLPHAGGDLIVTVPSDGRFKFSAVEPPALDETNAAYLAKRTSVFGPGKVTLRVRLETNMLLYALMPGSEAVDTKVEQPGGFPKAGQKVSE